MNRRRQLKIRSNPIVIRIAKYLAKCTITPNQISLLSIVFGAIGMIALITWNIIAIQSLQITLLIIAIIGIQGRLLCNLFDGMVAVEGGKKTPDGELYNDVPDRISDTLLFTGLGLGLSLPFATILGLTASLLALFTAYIRMVGLSMGTPAFFSGPMAKQHRMALLTVAIIVSIIGIFYGYAEMILYATLIIINIGTFITCLNRLVNIRKYLIENNIDENNDHSSTTDSDKSKEKAK